MRSLIFNVLFAYIAQIIHFNSLAGQNQTNALSPIFSESSLPFSLEIEEASFSLPTGIQSYASAIYKNKWIIFAGRTNGLHGFSPIGNNFPPCFKTLLFMLLILQPVLF